MKVKLHPTQYQVAVDRHRFKVVSAGRRWGKSTLTRMLLLKWAGENPGLYWIVSPTFQQGKDIHWLQGFKQELPKSIVLKYNDSELSVTLKNGAVIALKSSEHPDRLKGVKLSGLVVDEIASMRNWNWIWQEALRPTLTDQEAPAVFISTPKSFNHFYELFNTKHPDYKSWHFTSYDNPHIQKKEIDAAKRTLTEDYFAQEYLADFRRATGIAHKLWDRHHHLLDPFTVPKEWPRFRGFDYGSAHYTASVRLAVDQNNNFYVERCYFDHKRTIKDHAQAVKAQDYGLSFIPTYGDPTGAQWELEFASHGVHIIQANRETGQASRGWVEYCVERVNQKMQKQPGHAVHLPNMRQIDNAASFFVLDTKENQAFVKQVENLKWRETASGETVPHLDESDDPTGGHYDLMAALRYALVSYEKPPASYRPPRHDISRRNWAIGT